MGKAIQVQVTSPCHENWDQMTAADSGRYCGSCCKTVVDFTGMSDDQVLQFFIGRKNNEVCGRFYDDQLNRRIESAAKRRNPWIRQVLASLTAVALLLTNRVQAQHAIRRVKAPVHQAPTVGIQQTIVGDTIAVKVDSFKMLEPVTVRGFYNVGERFVVGGARSTICRSFSRKVADTTRRLLDKWTANPLRCWPNPVHRGAVVNVGWSVGAGTFRLSLVSVTGALIEDREIVIGGQGQVDQISLPVGLAAGVYVLRAQAPGKKDSFVKEIVVL